VVRLRGFGVVRGAVVLPDLWGCVVNGPRFVLLIGSIHEEYRDLPQPDLVLPSNGAVVCWDRQENCEVFRIDGKYAQAVCLELKGEAGPEGLCEWFNGLSDEALSSEGLTPDRLPWEGGAL
jgi:hypothetical protein